jgi:NADH:ubiquinone oxidoreductase subunit 4 (subunit M)
VTTDRDSLTLLVRQPLIAMYRHDIKGLLAYSTLSHLGLIVLPDRSRHAARPRSRRCST